MKVTQFWIKRSIKTKYEEKVVFLKPKTFVRKSKIIIWVIFALLAAPLMVYRMLRMIKIRVYFFGLPLDISRFRPFS
jgi:hypothetical protein